MNNDALLLDCFVRCVDMPCTIGGFVTPNEDGTYNIYINEKLPEEKQKAALRHELKHIKCNHHAKDGNIDDFENEAEG